MGRVFALLAVIAVAAVYRAYSGTTIAGAEILGISLSSGIVVLIVGGVSDYFAFLHDSTALDNRLIALLILRSLLFAAVTAATIAAALVYVAGPYETATTTLAGQFVAVALVSGTVAYGELISRYRDSPGRLLAASPTLVYICVNIVAGVTALMLVKEFEVFKDTNHKRVYEAMLAGFGAIAFFRTSLFTVRVAGSDLGIGPSTLLKALLESSDMMLDRWQGFNRGSVVKGIMANVDFTKAAVALPSLCFALTQGTSPQEQAALGDAVKRMSAPENTMPPSAKAVILGVLLIQQVGPEVLKRAVDLLGKSITT